LIIASYRRDYPIQWRETYRIISSFHWEHNETSYTSRESMQGSFQALDFGALGKYNKKVKIKASIIDNIQKMSHVHIYWDHYQIAATREGR